MKNTEKLEQLGILGDIRLRLDLDSRFDTSKDNIINQMSHNKIIAEYCAWHLGCSDWWNDMKNYFDQLEEFDKNEH